jgi:hypothetical protein
VSAVAPIADKSGFGWIVRQVPIVDTYLCELPVKVRGLTHYGCDMTLYKPYSASWRKIFVVIIPSFDVPEIEVV